MKFLDIIFAVAAAILILFFAFQITKLLIIGELSIFMGIICYLILGNIAFAAKRYFFPRK